MPLDLSGPRHHGQRAGLPDASHIAQATRAEKTATEPRVRSV